jgi:uncharacterized protein (TIRG00374 family)
LQRLRAVVARPWVRVLVSVGLLCAVATQVDFTTGGDRLENGRWRFFGFAVTLLLGAFVVGAARWHVLLKAAELEGTRLQTLRAYMIGVFSTNFLPSQFGGDVARAWLAGGPGTRVRAATTVVIDRLTILVCLLVLAWLVVLADSDPIPTSLLVALAATTVVVLVIMLGGAVVSATSGWRFRRILPSAVVQSLRDANVTARRCLSGARVLQAVVALGLVYQVLVVLALWLLARALALDLAFSVLVVSVPIVHVLTALPVSIGGLGVREGGFVILLGEAGVAPTDATLLSLLSGAAFAAASLPGAVALVIPHQR